MSQNIVANMVGFRLDDKQKVVEFLPKNEQLNSTKKRRAIFFGLYNCYVEKEMRLTKDEIKNGDNIYEVFQNKIASLSCCTQGCPHLFKLNFTAKKINFYHGCNSQEHTLKLYEKFKRLIQVDNQSELFFDLDDMFLHLVYERAKKVNPKAKVILLEKSIMLVDPRKEVSTALPIPAYMKLDSKTMGSNPIVKEHMTEACKKLNEKEKIKQVYLVYPKHPSFTRHISTE